MMTKTKWMAAGLLATAPLTVLAQNEEVHGLASRIIEGVLPVAIIFLVLFVFLRFTMKKCVIRDEPDTQSGMIPDAENGMKADRQSGT